MKTLAHFALLAVLFIAIVFVAREYSHRQQPTWLTTQAPGPAAEVIVPPAGPVVRQGFGFAPTPRALAPAETFVSPVPAPTARTPLPKPRPHSAPRAKHPKPKSYVKAPA